MLNWGPNGAWLIGRLGWIAVVGAVGYGGAQMVRYYLGVDAFADLRPRNDGVADEVAMQFEDVELRHYKAGKLSMSASADRLEMSKNRATFTMEGIDDGKLTGPKGETRFEANRANWNVALKQLSVSQGARVAGKEFDLKSDNALIDRQANTLTVPSSIQGTLKGGAARLENLQYNFDTEALRTGKANWSGRLPAIQETQDGAISRTPWDISADEIEDSGRNTKLSTYIRASATDGEVLVKAPKVELDRKTDVLTGTGRVFYYSAKANLVADKVVIDRKAKRATFTGNVVMLIKPKEENVAYKPQEEELPPFRPLVPDQVAAGRPDAPVNGPSDAERALDKKVRDGESVREYPTIVTSDKIDYYYRKGERRATISGNPQARQDLAGNRWRHVWSHEAFYDGEKETLRATSRNGEFEAIMKNSIGDSMRAKTVLLHTAENDERYKAENIKGRFLADPDEDPRDRGGSAPPATTGTTGTSGTTGGGGTTTGTTTGGGTTGGTTTGGTSSGGRSTSGTGRESKKLG